MLRKILDFSSSLKTTTNRQNKILNGSFKKTSNPILKTNKDSRNLFMTHRNESSKKMRFETNQSSVGRASPYEMFYRNRGEKFKSKQISPKKSIISTKEPLTK